MTSHYIKKCKVCGCVIEQCRCFDRNKTVLYGICSKCQTIDPSPTAWVGPTLSEDCELAKAPTEPPPTVASGLPTAQHMDDFVQKCFTARCKYCGQVRLIHIDDDGACSECRGKSSAMPSAPVPVSGNLKAQVYDLSLRRTATLQTDPALRLAEKLVAVITANTDTVDAVDHLIALELAGRAVMETIKHARGETWLNACIVDASRRIRAYEISWPDQDGSKTIYDEKPKEEPTKEVGNILAFPPKSEKT